MPPAAEAPRRWLAVRDDRLGDFMLAWPAFRLLKEANPAHTVIALVPEYTRPMAELCPWIDEVLVDSGASGVGGLLELRGRVRTARADAAIAFRSTLRVAGALALAGVPFRLAPASKLAQFLYTARLTQRRSASAKPEYEYNLDLARDGLRRCGLAVPAAPTGPYLGFPAAEREALRRETAQRLGLDPDARWLYVHAGGGGSANNLRSDQYLALCRRLARPGRGFVFTAGPGEEETARQLATQLGGYGPAAVLPPEGLARLARQLALADLFISGSTGPLHVAGALDRPTATFYPAHRSGSPLRWQTLNRAAVRLAFSPPAGGDPKDVSRTDVDAAALAIEGLLSRLYG